MSEGDYYLRVSDLGRQHQIVRKNGAMYIMVRPDELKANDLLTIYEMVDGGRMVKAEGVEQLIGEGLHMRSSEYAIECFIEGHDEYLIQGYETEEKGSEIGKLLVEYIFSKLFPLVSLIKQLGAGDFTEVDKTLSTLIREINAGCYAIAEICQEIGDLNEQLENRARSAIQKAKEETRIREEAVKSAQSIHELRYMKWVDAAKTVSRKRHEIETVIETLGKLGNGIFKKIAEWRSNLEESHPDIRDHYRELCQIRDELKLFNQGNDTLSEEMILTRIDRARVVIDEVNTFVEIIAEQEEQAKKNILEQLKREDADSTALLNEFHTALNELHAYHREYEENQAMLDGDTSRAILPYEQGSGVSSEITKTVYDAALACIKDPTLRPATLLEQIQQRSRRCRDRCAMKVSLSDNFCDLLEELNSEITCFEAFLAQTRNREQDEAPTPEDSTPHTMDPEAQAPPASNLDTVEKAETSEPDSKEAAEDPPAEVSSSPPASEEIILLYRYTLIAAAVMTSHSSPISAQNFSTLYETARSYLEKTGSVSAENAQQREALDTYLRDPSRCIEGPKAPDVSAPMVKQQVAQSNLPLINYDVSKKRKDTFKITRAGVERARQFAQELGFNFEKALADYEAQRRARRQAKQAAEKNSSTPPKATALPDPSPQLVAAEPDPPADVNTEKTPAEHQETEQSFPYLEPANYHANGASTTVEEVEELLRWMQCISLACLKTGDESGKHPSDLLGALIQLGKRSRSQVNRSFVAICAAIERDAGSLKDKKMWVTTLHAETDKTLISIHPNRAKEVEHLGRKLRTDWFLLQKALRRQIDTRMQ